MGFTLTPNMRIAARTRSHNNEVYCNDWDNTGCGVLLSLQGRINSTLQKQGQHTRIAVYAVMGYFPVGKEPHQREITQLFLNQL